MIFYGTKAAHLKSERVSGVKCSHCDQQTPHNISIYGKYAYLYWIPVFPMSKKGVSECQNCKATLEPKEMSEQLRLKYDNVKRDVKTPYTHWIGTFILSILIGFVFYAGAQHEKDVVEWIANPQQGDIIEYKPTGYYSTLKVTRVTNDSIFFAPNKYEIEKRRKVYKIDKAENYAEEAYGILKSEYKSMFDTKKFLDVDR